HEQKQAEATPSSFRVCRVRQNPTVISGKLVHSGSPVVKNRPLQMTRDAHGDRR
ncbi:unnamed protein product, partial [Lampetra fluviatilis]